MAAVALCCLLSAAGLQRPAATLAATVAKCGAASTADRLLRVTVSDVATSSGLDLVTVRSRLAELSSEVPGSSMEAHAESAHSLVMSPRRHTPMRGEHRDSSQTRRNADICWPDAAGLCNPAAAD